MSKILTEMVPMRDGIKLFTTIHFPEGQGPFPVILVRNLYRGKGNVASQQEVTERGIALVEQDVCVGKQRVVSGEIFWQLL